MEAIPFNRPHFQPLDLTHVNDPRTLSTSIGQAFTQYLTFLQNTLRPAQQQWAKDVLAAAHPAPYDLARAHFVIENPRLAFTPYVLNDGTRDVINPHSSIGDLYAYMSQERMHEHLEKRGLRVSYGAQNVDHLQPGEKLLTGAYATTVTPYDNGVGTNMMADLFFGEHSVGVDVSPGVVDTSYFVAFCPTDRFTSEGDLVYPRLDCLGWRYYHYALPTPGHHVGDYIPFDIVAYGKTLIPPEPVDHQRGLDELREKLQKISESGKK